MARRSQSDAWRLQYSADIDIIAVDENQPFIRFNEVYDLKVDEIQLFMSSDVYHTHFGKHLVPRLREFCQGADAFLHDFVAVTPQELQTEIVPQTIAWVSDRNWNPQELNTPRDYEQVLSTTRFDYLRIVLWSFLQGEYGPSILALIKTASLSQAQGYRELFANYITPTPRTRITLRESNWWRGCFILLANLRYFAVSQKDIKDARTIGGTRRLRRRVDLSFLNPRNLTKEECDEEPNFLGQAFLYEAACSFMSTGTSDSYWTAACLNEDLFEDTPRLEFEEGLDIDGLLGDEFDPLILEPLMQTTPSPRTYFLVFLTKIVTSIVGHQQVIECWISASLARHSPNREKDSPYHLSPEEAKEWIKISLEVLRTVLDAISQLRRELERFLEEEVQFGTNRIPKGPMFASLKKDRLAIITLKSLHSLPPELQAVEVTMQGYRKDFEELRDQLQYETENELGEKFGTMTRVSIIGSLVALFVTILGVVAQLYSNTGKTIILGMILSGACFGVALMAAVFNGWGLPIKFVCLSTTTYHLSSILIVAMATCTVNGLQDLLGKVGLDTPVPEFPGGDIVHNPQDIFRAYLADTLQKLVEVDRVVAYDAIQPSNMTGMGDLVIVSPRLRLKDVKPKDLVSDLAHRLPRSPPFACPIPDGIHLRVLSSPNTLSRLLLPYVHDRNTSYGYDDSVGLVDGNAPGGPKKKVIVEFSSPNMASEFQVSHLRSTLIGSYVANIHAGMGWDVIKMNYLGDWGKQIGLLAAGWQRFGSEEEFQKAPLQHLLQVNHKIEELFKPEQEECKVAKGEGKDVTEIESRGLYAERDEFFKKMEDKEPEAIALWQRFRDATVEDYKASYGRLGIQFDEYSGESQASPESVEEVETALKEKGVYEEHEGAWTIDFSKHDAKGLSTAIVRYRNGTTSYLLRDLAAVLDRYKKHSFDKMIYVVAMEQEMHFHRLTKTLELIGRNDVAEKIQHVAFAKITGLLDEFKDAQLLSDYIDGCRSVMQAEMAEETEDGIFVTKTDKSLESVGLSGLFIQDLNHKRTTGYACDAKRMTAFEGETGAAIQNCYARLVTTLEGKTDGIDYDTLDYSQLETEDYSEVLRIMTQFPDTTYASFKTLEPTTVIIYLGRLVDQIMITLDDDDEQDWTDREEATKARMALYENARQVLENGLRMLGLSPWSA
ncbi:hypothetical protein BGZ61DRAFT_528019 [Ilyonectria robusta]|uniref:uncharacterized protein n=1 Tax=Ilyonectria robusta TaxID=1079257 RepID=UPI001E8DBACF|nr:uncharacterized protein BGZ61DRAFT_528019 [Ilyonectria robusta]KAH8734715.1 hypothetical protein BGZ61DRAFT_528019 [Ilyonectria robusta]